MKYKWSRGSHGEVDAKVAAKELERIQKKHGTLVAEVVVREAKKNKSPIHDCFEWDDTAAAAQHRLSQARYIIRSIEVVYTPADDTEPLRVRAFHSVFNEEQENEYVTIKQARKDSNLWQQVLDQATKEIKSWRVKYRDLKEFETVFKEIDKAF